MLSFKYKYNTLHVESATETEKNWCFFSLTSSDAPWAKCSHFLYVHKMVLFPYE